MAAARGRGLRPGGVVRAIGRLALLIGVGFAAGLLIGVLSEEPELLAGHLRGESEDVILAPRVEETDLSRTAALPSEDSAALASKREAIMEPRPEEIPSEVLPRVAASVATPAVKTAATTPTTPTNPTTPANPTHPTNPIKPTNPNRPTPASSSERDWAIQVGAFVDEAAAMRLAEGLRRKDYPVEVLTGGGEAGRWRVRVQPVEGEATAKAMAARLKSAERLPTWVIPMEGRSGR